MKKRRKMTGDLSEVRVYGEDGDAWYRWPMCLLRQECQDDSSPRWAQVCTTCLISETMDEKVSASPCTPNAVSGVSHTPHTIRGVTHHTVRGVTHTILLGVSPHTTYCQGCHHIPHTVRGITHTTHYQGITHVILSEVSPHHTLSWGHTHHTL